MIEANKAVECVQEVLRVAEKWRADAAREAKARQVAENESAKLRAELAKTQDQLHGQCKAWEEAIKYGDKRQAECDRLTDLVRSLRVSLREVAGKPEMVTP